MSSKVTHYYRQAKEIQAENGDIYKLISILDEKRQVKEHGILVVTQFHDIKDSKNNKEEIILLFTLKEDGKLEYKHIYFGASALYENEFIGNTGFPIDLPRLKFESWQMLLNSYESYNQKESNFPTDEERSLDNFVEVIIKKTDGREIALGEKYFGQVLLREIESRDEKTRETSQELKENKHKPFGKISRY